MSDLRIVCQKCDAVIKEKRITIDNRTNVCYYLRTVKNQDMAYW